MKSRKGMATTMLALVSAAGFSSPAQSSRDQRYTFRNESSKWAIGLPSKALEYRFRTKYLSETWETADFAIDRNGPKIVYRGTLYHSNVVAREAITDEREFVLELVESPCLDSKGRMLPITALFTFGSHSENLHKERGCGTRMPDVRQLPQ
jgi:hypothetical protein